MLVSRVVIKVSKFVIVESVDNLHRYDVAPNVGFTLIVNVESVAETNTGVSGLSGATWSVSVLTGKSALKSDDPIALSLLTSIKYWVFASSPVIVTCGSVVVTLRSSFVIRESVEILQVYDCAPSISLGSLTEIELCALDSNIGNGGTPGRVLSVRVSNLGENGVSPNGF